MGLQSIIQINVLCFQFVKECLRFVFGFIVVTFMSDINVRGKVINVREKVFNF